MEFRSLCVPLHASLPLYCSLNGGCTRILGQTTTIQPLFSFLFTTTIRTRIKLITGFICLLLLSSLANDHFITLFNLSSIQLILFIRQSYSTLHISSSSLSFPLFFIYSFSFLQIILFSLSFLAYI